MRAIPGILILFSLSGAIGCGASTANNGGGGSGGGDTKSDLSLTGSDSGGGGDSGGVGSDGSGAGTDGSGETLTDGGGDANLDGASGEDVDPGPGNCPNVLKDKALGAHGKPCSDDSECAYGMCQKGGFLVGYDAGIGYCTKDCNCPDKSAPCSDDNVGVGNPGTVEFTCAHEMSKSGNNPKAGAFPEWRCSRSCKKDAECAGWNPKLPHCVGSTTYVSSNGVCGFDPAKGAP